MVYFFCSRNTIYVFDNTVLQLWSFFIGLQLHITPDLWYVCFLCLLDSFAQICITLIGHGWADYSPEVFCARPKSIPYPIAALFYSVCVYTSESICYSTELVILYDVVLRL